MVTESSTAGSVELQDGRRATLLRVKGTNTRNLPAGKKQTKINQLTEELEHTVATEERWWAYYSTTRSASAETLTNHWKKRATDHSNDLTTDQREALTEAAEWLESQDEKEYDANERRDYIVVEADPQESAVRAPEGSFAERHKSLKQRLKSFTGSKLGTGEDDNTDATDTQKNPENDTAAGGEESSTQTYQEPSENAKTDGGSAALDGESETNDSPSADEISEDSEIAETTESDKSGDTTETADEKSAESGSDESISEEVLTGDPLPKVLSKRAEMFESAFESVDGLDVERAGPREHVEVLRAYWTSCPESAEPGLMELFERDWGDDHQTPTERLLASGGYDVDGNTVRIGDTYCRTFWISDWPLWPNAMFLEKLHTMTNVDFDSKVHATPIHPYKAPDEVKDEALDVAAREIEHQEDTPLAAMTIEDKREAYTIAHEQITDKNARAWYMNGYVTIRASSKKELREDAKEVKKTFESPPAKCAPVAPEKRQHECFLSASPFGEDLYNQGATPARERVVLSGGLSAMFPFVSMSFDEEGGLLWGRNTHTTEPVIIDPFARGTAPHIITIGMSRAGKSHFVTEALLQWFLDRDDRTLIVADTQGEFGPLTDRCGGERIVIDSNQPINPMHIEPPPEDYWDEDVDDMDDMGSVPSDGLGGVTEGDEGLQGYNPLAAKEDEVAQLIVSLTEAGSFLTGDESGMASGGGDVSIAEKYQMARYIAGRTYSNAGIVEDDLSTHALPSPTLEDYREAASEIRDEVGAGKHTHLETETEIETRKAQIDAVFSGLLELLEEGRYTHLMGEGSNDLLDPDVRMGYLDLQQFSGDADVSKSIGLQIALSQISQKVKQAPGQTIFLIDEAHVLYSNKRIMHWLERASREWARYEGCMWSVSQSPEEFVHRLDSVDADQENKRQVIREQTSMRQVFYSPETDVETLSKFGLEPNNVTTAKNELTPGRDHDHSECLIHLNDYEGWIRTKIETVPLCGEHGDTDGDAESGQSGDGYEHLNDLVTIGGVGRTYGEELYAEGIKTPGDLLETDTGTVASITSAAPSEIDHWYQSALEITSDGSYEASHPSEATDNEDEAKAGAGAGAEARTDPKMESETESGSEVTTASSTEQSQSNGTSPSAAASSSSIEPTEVTSIEGIGDTYGERLCAEGIESHGDLLDTEHETVVSITDAPSGEVDRWYKNAKTNGDSVAAADGGSPDDG